MENTLFKGSLSQSKIWHFRSQRVVVDVKEPMVPRFFKNFHLATHREVENIEKWPFSWVFFERLAAPPKLKFGMVDYRDSIQKVGHALVSIFRAISDMALQSGHFCRKMPFLAIFKCIFRPPNDLTDGFGGHKYWIWLNWQLFERQFFEFCPLAKVRPFRKFSLFCTSTSQCDVSPARTDGNRQRTAGKITFSVHFSESI